MFIQSAVQPRRPAQVQACSPKVHSSWSEMFTVAIITEMHGEKDDNNLNTWNKKTIKYYVQLLFTLEYAFRGVGLDTRL